MTQNLDEVMRDKIVSMKRRYIKALGEHTERLEHLLTLCSNENLDVEDKKELLSHAHNLAGNGETFGFADRSKFGRKLQNTIKSNPDAQANRFIDQLSKLIDSCNSAIRSKAEEKNNAANQNEIGSNISGDELPVVLVVDDDENIQLAIQSLLQNDAHIITCSNSDEMVGIIRQSRPDLVLLYDMMPGADSGLKMLEKMQSLYDIKNTPVVMLTANEKPDDVMRALMAGAVDYIIKPFNPNVFVKKIQTRLRRINSRILIVDDDEAVREVLRYRLISSGCKVTCASDGAQAWDKMQKQSFALVIMDCMMPGYDGMTVFRMMKQNPKLANTPLIFLSAKHSNADIMDGLNSGAADYISKPFNPEEVVTRCVRLIQQPKAN